MFVAKYKVNCNLIMYVLLSLEGYQRPCMLQFIISAKFLDAIWFTSDEQVTNIRLSRTIMYMGFITFAHSSNVCWMLSGSLQVLHRLFALSPQ